MLLAVVLVFVSAFLTNLLRLQVSALAYQRLASTPPYTVQMLSAFVLGFALSASPRSRKCALWIWVLPAVWILLALATGSQSKGKCLGVAIFLHGIVVATLTVAPSLTVGNCPVYAHRPVVHVTGLHARRVATTAGQNAPTEAYGSSHRGGLDSQLS